MNQTELKKISVIDMDETLFSVGALFTFGEDSNKGWEIQIMNVANVSLYSLALRESQNLEIKIVTIHDEKWKGNVMVKNIRSISQGLNIHLMGNGPLYSCTD
jgi:hypothetical protein